MNGFFSGTVKDTVRPDYDYLINVEMVDCAVYATCATVYYEDISGGGWNCSGSWSVRGYHKAGTGYNCFNNLYPCWSLTENLDVGEVSYKSTLVLDNIHLAMRCDISHSLLSSSFPPPFSLSLL
jgi:hypothetical protein